MLSFLRTGFFKDLLIWFIISVILASLVAAGSVWSPTGISRPRWTV